VASHRRIFSLSISIRIIDKLLNFHVCYKEYPIRTLSCHPQVSNPSLNVRNTNLSLSDYGLYLFNVLFDGLGQCSSTI